jgi:hypothetical protein
MPRYKIITSVDYVFMVDAKDESAAKREGSNYLSHDTKSTVSHINVVEAQEGLIETETEAESGIVQVKFDNVGDAFALAVRLQAEGLNPVIIRPKLNALIEKELDELL